MIIVAIILLLAAITGSVSITLQVLYWNGKLLFASSKTYLALQGIGFMSMLVAGNLSAKLFQFLASLN
jgi:hypothetical protein